jgi:hypothetical protein
LPRDHQARSTKWILVEHFVDTVVLIGLELLLALLIRGISQVLPDMVDVLGFVTLFSKWFSVAALGQFALESLLSLAEKDVPRLRRLFRR